MRRVPINKKNIFIIALISLLYLVGIGWGLPSHISAVTDTIAPYDTLSFFGNYSNPHAASRYPAAQYLILSFVYAVVLGFGKLTGMIGSFSSKFPYGMKSPEYFISGMIIAARIVTITMGMIVLLSLRKFKHASLSNFGNIVAILIIGLSGTFTYYARAENVDIPMLCWWAVSQASLWAYIFFDENKKRNLLMAGAAAGLAVATKDAAAVLVLAAGLIVIFFGVSKVKDATQFASASLLTYFAVAVLSQPWRWIEHVKLNNPSGGRIARFAQFDNSFSGQIALLNKTFFELVSIVSPVGIALALAGVVALMLHRQHRVLIFLVLPCLFYYLIFIMNIRFVYERFLLPIAVATAILAGFGATFLLQNFRRTGQLMVAMCIVWQLGFGYLPITYAQVFDIKRTLTKTMREEVPAGEAVMWIGDRTYIPNAEFTSQYTLVRPRDVNLKSSYMAAALKPYEERAEFVLSEKPLPDEKLRLIRELSYPVWVRANVIKAGVKEYYLYKSKCGACFDGKEEWIRQGDDAGVR